MHCIYSRFVLLLFMSCRELTALFEVADYQKPLCVHGSVGVNEPILLMVHAAFLLLAHQPIPSSSTTASHSELRDHQIQNDEASYSTRGFSLKTNQDSTMSPQHKLNKFDAQLH